MQGAHISRPTRARWRLLGAALAWALVAAWGAAAAAQERVEGVVVAVEEGEIIVDLGREDGLANGAEVLLYRHLEVKHPVTGKTIVDRFPAGAMALEKVGEQLSVTLLKGQEQLERYPRAGDFVVWEPKPERVAPIELAEEPLKAVGPALKAIEQAFSRTLGQPLDVRVAVWERYLKEHPQSPYLTQVGRELEWLRLKLAEARRARVALEKQEDKARRDRPLKGVVVTPRWLARGQEPLVVTATVDEAQLVSRMRILLRRPDDTGFEAVDMARSGDFAWSVRLGAPWTDAERLDFFVEAVRTNGELEPVANDAGSPGTLFIEEPEPKVQARGGRSRARTTFEAVDFKSGEGDDSFLRFESDYRYTMDFGIFKAFTVGIGIFDGEGGTVNQVERGETRSLNTNYGFAELELGLHRVVGLSGRVLVGDQSRDEEAALSGAFGFRGQLRIGEFDGTRLELGGALTDGLGTEGWIGLWIAAVEDLPMLGEVIVTNLPVGEDLGVSLNYGVGYEVLEGFLPMVRVGWNARTINHTGFSAGLSAAYSW